MTNPKVGSVPKISELTARSEGNAVRFHPLADFFPLIEGAEFHDLVADIRAHGVLEPVWIYEDKILDGRNRWLASQAAGVDCPTRIYDSADPLGFVISLNLKRRHLDTSQRAMIAARLANMPQGARTDLTANAVKFTSQDDAARLFNVSIDSLQRAKSVQDRGDPELIRAVDSGDISVAGAVKQLQRGLPPAALRERRPKAKAQAEPVPEDARLAASEDGRVAAAWEVIFRTCDRTEVINQFLIRAKERWSPDDLAAFGEWVLKCGRLYSEVKTRQNGVPRIALARPAQ